jgi:hypothetical protein
MIRVFYGQLRNVKNAFTKTFTKTTMHLNWNEYRDYCTKQGILWEIIWHTVCNNLPKNPLWLYRYRVKFTDSIEITQSSCEDCGVHSLHKDVKLDNQIPITIVFPPQFDMNYDITVKETRDIKEIIVASLESAISVRKYYSEKLCTKTNTCGENYFMTNDFAQVIIFWNYAVQMFSFIKEINELFNTKIVSVIVSFYDRIEMKRLIRNVASDH